jgi:acetyl esterase/lipase
MKRFGRWISACSALLSALTLLRPRSGTLRILLWLPKALSEARTPFLALMGAIGALWGLAFKDVPAFLAGLFGFATSLRHVIRVAAPHGGFDRIFGESWEMSIPRELRVRMLRARWSPRVEDPPRVPWERDITIGNNPDSNDPIWVDIWKPPEDVQPTGLGVIYLHGSGWYFADKDMRTRRFFQHLAGQGHVIMDVAYTLAPKARLWGMLADVKQAIAWFKSHSDKYGVNPKRIVLMGGSAGGHLALLAAYTPNIPEFQPTDRKADTTVRAVVSYYGPSDLIHQQYYMASKFRNYPHGRNRLERIFITLFERWAWRKGFLPAYGRYVTPDEILPGIIGGTPDENQEAFHRGSPLYHIGENCPPTLLLQGTHDFAGMHPDVCRFYQALIEAGVPSILVEFPNTEHAFDILSPKWSPATQAATYDVERFLALMAEDLELVAP